MDINPASLIKVSAGRDKGKYMLVSEILDKDYIMVCDGRRRRIENPKKKKLKHIENLNYSLGRIKEKLEEGKKISNSDIKKSIRSALIDLGILNME